MTQYCYEHQMKYKEIDGKMICPKCEKPKEIKPIKKDKEEGYEHRESTKTGDTTHRK